MHPEYLVLESFLDPIYQSPKLLQPKSRADHKDFTFFLLHLRWIFLLPLI